MPRKKKELRPPIFFDDSVTLKFVWDSSAGPAGHAVPHPGRHMKHFDMAQWTDYVRGVAEPGQREAMACHLATGCKACTRLAQMSRAHEAGLREAALEQPVHAEDAAFPPCRDDASPARKRTAVLNARVVSSNLEGRVAVGARTGAETLVQALCQAGEYAIDLQIEPEFEAGEMSLVGEVVKHAAGEPLSGAPVRLMAGRKTVALSETNRFGEFCIVSRMQRGLKLCVDIQAVDQRLGISLDKLTAGFRI
jgi:hypothetical protein